MVFKFNFCGYYSFNKLIQIFFMYPWWLQAVHGRGSYTYTSILLLDSEPSLHELRKRMMEICNATIEEHAWVPVNVPQDPDMI